jgi:hypothetical protein
MRDAGERAVVKPVVGLHTRRDARRLTGGAAGGKHMLTPAVRSRRHDAAVPPLGESYAERALVFIERYSHARRPRWRFNRWRQREAGSCWSWPTRRDRRGGARRADGGALYARRPDRGTTGARASSIRTVEPSLFLSLRITPAAERFTVAPQL